MFNRKEWRKKHQRENKEVYRRYNKKHVESNPEYYKEYFRKHSKTYRLANKDKVSLSKKTYEVSHKDEIAAYHKARYQANKEEILAHTYEYQRKRRKIDPMYRLSSYLRVRLRTTLKAKSWKKTTRFAVYIGCTLEELKAHLEKQFQSGMTWGNMGEWETDHIIPLSSAKTKEELYKLMHYTNLQPLWRAANRKKSDNY